MSFDLNCSNCGAPSGPSVGVCPYCKTIATKNSKGKPENPTITAIRKAYSEGNIAKALQLASQAEHSKDQMYANVRFAVLYAKILLETEAPSSKLRGFLSQAVLANPEAPELSEWLELAIAKSQLVKGLEDLGESSLKNILRRSPRNGHAGFVLGAHFFWEEKSVRTALPYLEIAARECPNFLRALACLASAYTEIGAIPQAKALLKKCITLETNQNMKTFFKSQHDRL